MIDRIKEATGQSEEDITTMLMECNYDVNETIVALIESELAAADATQHWLATHQATPTPTTDPFCQVTGKKDKLKKKVGSKTRDICARTCYGIVVPPQDEDRKKDGFKVVEVRRQSTGSRHRTQERTGTSFCGGGYPIS